MEREVRDLLERPFTPKFIKKRKGNYGQMLDYIEAHVVIDRLNKAFQGDWSFEVCEYTQLEDEVIVLGRLTAGDVVKQQFGNSKVSRYNDSNESISIGDDLKSAASDSLKKCSTLLGVGLHLYGLMEDSEATAESTKEAAPPRGSGMSSMSGNRGTDVITKEQLAQVKKLRTSLGWSAEDVLAKVERLFGTKNVTTINSVAATAFISYLEGQGNGSHK